MTFLSQFLCRGDAAAVGCRSNQAAAVPNVISLDPSSRHSYESIDEPELLKIMVGDDKVPEAGSIHDDVSATGTETEQEEGLAEDEEEEEEEQADEASECEEVTEEIDVQEEESTPMDEPEPVQEVRAQTTEDPTTVADEVHSDDEGETSSSADTSSHTEDIEDSNEELKKTAPPTPVSQAAKVISGPPRTRRTAYDLSQLLGESLLVKYAEADEEFADETESFVDTNKALAGRSVVAVYIGSGQHKDAIALFDAGYDATSLAVVYGWASTTDDCCEGTTGFETMPNRWFMSEDYETMLEKCPEQDDEVLIVLDPWSGKVLCPNALPQLLELDPTLSEYDSQAENLMQSWISGLPMKQVVVGHMEIPLR